jgi:prolyl oligopeptidase
MSLRRAVALTALALAACQTPKRSIYPDSARGEVVDDYHGTSVADPYRWLEDSDSPATRRWIEAQNQLTRSQLDGIPGRAKVRSTLERLWTYERFGLPRREGKAYYFTYNDGRMDQSLLVRADQPGASIADCDVVLDPSSWSDDGTVSLGGTSFSWNGRYLAYGQSDGGSDWRTWRVRDLKTGRDLPDVIQWSRFSTPEWSFDDAGFYYMRFPETEDRLTTSALPASVAYHRLGTSQDEDEVVYEDPEHPERFFGITVTEDGRFLVLYLGTGTSRLNGLWFKDLSPSASGQWVKTFDDFDASYEMLGNDGWNFWLRTDKDAPKSRIVKVDCSAAGNPLVEIVPQLDHALTDASMIGGRLLAHYLVDAQSEVRLFEASGALVEKVDLPGAGSISGMQGRRRRAETFLRYSSFNDPGTTYRYDVQAAQLTEVRRAKADFDTQRYVAEQVFYPSKDGTRIPMFLVHRKGLVLDGSAPTLLTGYGGFNIPIRPRFSPRAAAWLELGGVYAVACLRGGGEYGQEWHAAGTLEHKQNVFDDFIGAAKWLIGEGYTSTSKLAIMGGSNGGLLVGACVNQRPDLFAAALPAVGVMDMLRYQHFTIGRAWASDYGLSSDPEIFPTLLAYSPVHTTVEGKRYPPVLITTGDHDDRVVPAHSFKYAAALQHAQGGEAPILIRIETRAGHGAGKSREQALDEITDQFSFLVEHLGMGLE